MSAEADSKTTDTRRFSTLKTTVREMNQAYRGGFEKALVASLVFHLVMFGMLPKKIRFEGTEIKSPSQVEFQAEDIPQTQQEMKRAVPPRPAVPIPSENEEIPEDLTIEETELDFDETLPPPPPPPQKSADDEYVFIPYDSPPEPVGGFGSLNKYLKYPEMARLAGVEGRVVVGVLIDTNGNSVKTQILQSSNAGVGFEEAAATAVMKMKWKPAMQRDKPVKVWISVNVRFTLETAA